MKGRLALPVVILAVAATASAQRNSLTALPEPIRVDGGLISGTPAPQWTFGIRAFRGIPYAAPPVNDLRWRPPQPVIPWQGVRAADHFDAACMQAPTDTEGNAWREGALPVSEDCLFINVWTPAHTPADKLPVMVFIHGGGNTRGASSENQYDGDYLAKKGVVFVSFNYRMNVFGFLAHPDLTRESEHHSSGNYALLDQIAALQWIQRNIAAFGGDPDRVMIFGHSAGSSSVSCLVASPLAKGLFQRALMESGNNLSNRTSLAAAEKTGVQFAQSVDAASIAELRSKSADEILKAWVAWHQPTGTTRTMGPMGTIVDGWVLPQDAYSIFAQGKQNDVPLIVGTVADDTPGPVIAPKAADYSEYARKTFGDLAGTYLKLYPAATDAEAASAAHAFRTNSAMASARRLARLQTRTGTSRVYWYYFTHISPMPAGLMWGGRPAQSWGAYHGSELMYVFNAFPLQDWPWRSVDLKLGEVVSSMWVNFARSGDPNGAGLPQWPAYDANSDRLMNFSDAPKAEKAPYEDKLNFIDEYVTRERMSPNPAH